MNRTGRFVLAFAAACLAPAARAASEPLAESLEKRAPDVVKALKAKGAENVGVLKFLVRRGDEPLRDDAGELNTSLTVKTHMALTLALQGEDGIALLDKPSEFVTDNRIAKANHRTEAGRKAFFDTRFPLTVGGGKAVPSAFVVGTVAFAPDLSAATVELSVFDKTGKLETVAGPWQVCPDKDMLGEAGLSYALGPIQRKALVSGGAVTAREVQKEAAAVAAAAAKPAETATPYAPLAACPLKWEVRYNGKAVTPTGNALPEPDEDDKVSFVLTNPTADTYAAVLLVNGENTLYQERAAVVSCRKWVLEPRTEVVVSGFQTAASEATPFRVTKPDEPLPDGVRYGEALGTFRLVVYAGTVGKEPPKPSAPPTDSQLIASARGTAAPPGLKPQTLRALQAAYRDGRADATNSRGAVVKGSGTERFETVEAVFVPASEQPVADVSLRYFTPKADAPKK